MSDATGDRPALMRWGLVPFWARDPSVGNRMINARAETILEKSAFRHAFQKRRCLVVADGFYEWRKTPWGRIPMRIILRSGEPFAFAGLWETWKSPEGGFIRSCAIVTTTPNALVEPIHDRMPVILPREAEARWLASQEEGIALSELLVPYPPEEMEAYQVSPLVNSSRNDSPDVIARVGLR